MKTYTISRRISKQAKCEIERIIKTHEKFRHAYFFTPASSAWARRNNEQRFKLENPDVCLVHRGEIIKVAMTYSESCSNCYYRLYVSSYDGQTVKSKSIAFIKKLLS